MTPQPPVGRPSDPVRLGVAGLGAVAQAVHLPLLERLRADFVIDAVADLSPGLRSVIGERYRVPDDRRFASVRELVGAGGLDAVAILTSGSHAAAVTTALDAGLPVFSEKPLAYTLAEVAEIEARLADVAAPRLQLGYMKLYDPAVRHARDLARDRGYGPPRAIEVTVLHPSSESQLAHARLQPPPTDIGAEDRAALTDVTQRLRADALGDAAGQAFGPLYTDILLGSVVHELALVRDFAGDPTGIDALTVWPDAAWPPSLELTGRLRHDGRVTIAWHYLPNYPAYRELIRVVYDTATIELEFPSPYLLHRPTVSRVTSTEDGGRRDEVWTSIEEAFETELLAFRAMVVDQERPVAHAMQGRADIVTCQRAVAALARARGIALGGEAARATA